MQIMFVMGLGIESPSLALPLPTVRSIAGGTRFTAILQLSYSLFCIT